MFYIFVDNIKFFIYKWRSGRKDKINKQARARYHKNKDKILAQKRKKYNDNKEHMHEYQKQWRGLCQTIPQWAKDQISHRVSWCKISPSGLEIYCQAPGAKQIRSTAV